LVSALTGRAMPDPISTLRCRAAFFLLAKRGSIAVQESTTAIDQRLC
jgi:hypothetical protein